MNKLVALAALTLIHAQTRQECTFDTEDGAKNFLANVEDPDSWNLKAEEGEVAGGEAGEILQAASQEGEPTTEQNSEPEVTELAPTETTATAATETATDASQANAGTAEGTAN